MKRLITLLALLLVVGGCAASRQVVEDTKAGLSAPSAPGELTPIEAGKEAAAPIGALPIPYAGQVATVVGTLLGLWYANRRGRAIRLGTQTPIEKPFFGWGGKQIGLEQLTQVAANIAAFIFERGPDGSVRKRSWKAIAAVGLPAATLAIPQVREFVTANADTIQEAIAYLTAYLGAGAATVLGGEKALSVVKPVAAPVA